MSQPNLDELIALGEKCGPSPFMESEFNRFNAHTRAFAVAACNAAVPMAVELKAAREKIERIREILDKLSLPFNEAREMAALLAGEGKETK